MPKRRYSEEFYSEIDKLIRSQTELSNKRYETLKSVQIVEDEKKVKSKTGYVPPPSFWTIVKKSRLLAYVVIFICVIIITASVASIVDHKFEIPENLKLSKNGKNNNGKIRENHKETTKYTAYRGKLEVTKKPVPENWLKEPVKRKLNTLPDKKRSVKKIPKAPYNPGKKFEGNPIILDEKNVIFDR